MATVCERLHHNNPTSDELRWPYRSSSLSLRVGNGCLKQLTLHGMSLSDVQSLEFLHSSAPNLRELSRQGVILCNQTATSIAACVGRSQLHVLHLENLVPLGSTGPCRNLHLCQPWRILCEGKCSLPFMERFEIRDVPFDLPQLWEVLSGATNLHELSLQRCVLSSSTARSIAQSIHKSTLRKLHLETLLFPGGILEQYQLWDMLREAMTSVQTIQELELRDVRGDFQGWENLVSRLEVLCVYDWYWDVTQLACALQRNTSLKRLALQSFHFAHTWIDLVNALSNRPATLQSLDLSNNVEVGYDGLELIAAVIQNQPNLTTVYLANCATDNWILLVNGAITRYQHCVGDQDKHLSTPQTAILR